MKSRDYHNEIDPYAAQWTRNLMKKGLIPDGFVDERDIRDVQPMDLWGFTRCHFFSGIAGWACALRLAGVSDDFPLWTGSCPCQPFSVAGQQKGFADERHLWPIWAKLIAQSRPAIVLGEQVAGAAAWLRLVRSDLEAMGYAVGAIPVEAASAGAYHLRDRFWYVAYSESEQARPARQPWQCGDVGTTRATDGGTRRPEQSSERGGQPFRSQAAQAHWPTTTTRDYKDGAYNPSVPINSLLGRTVWPTPTRQDAASSGAAGYSTESDRHSGTTLTDAMRFSTGSSAPTENCGALNPEFVCWLMGYSPEHLSCAPTETRSTSGRPRRSSKPRSPAAPEEDLFG